MSVCPQACVSVESSRREAAPPSWVGRCDARCEYTPMSVVLHTRAQEKGLMASQA